MATSCPHCHQPIVDPPLERLMRALRKLNLERAGEAARAAEARTAKGPAPIVRWRGEGYDE